jgi:hypothetical protein
MTSYLVRYPFSDLSSSKGRLFEHPVGTWADLATLLEHDPQTANVLSALQSDCQRTLRLTWLDYPDLKLGYCLILFYVESLGWNSLAITKPD